MIRGAAGIARGLWRFRRSRPEGAPDVPETIGDGSGAEMIWAAREGMEGHGWLRSIPPRKAWGCRQPLPVRDAGEKVTSATKAGSQRRRFSERRIAGATGSLTPCRYEGGNRGFDELLGGLASSQKRSRRHGSNVCGGNSWFEVPPTARNLGHPPCSDPNRSPEHPPIAISPR